MLSAPERPTVADGHRRDVGQAPLGRRRPPRSWPRSPLRRPPPPARRPPASRSRAPPRGRGAAARRARPGRPAAGRAPRASAPASPLANSSPARPPSSTRRNASRSLATIGAPAAIASARMMPKHSPPVFGASTGRRCAAPAPCPSSLTRPRNATRSRTRPGLSHASSGSPGPGDQQPQAGPVGGERRRTRRSSTGSPCGARRSGRGSRSRRPSPGQPGSGSASANCGHRDPVRDHHRVAAQVLDLHLAGLPR